MARSISTGVAKSDTGLRSSLEKIQIALGDMLLNTGGLAIGSTKTKIKIANTIYTLHDGVMAKKTTAEVSPSGTVTNANFNVYVVSVDSAGTATVSMGTEGATIGAVVFPTVPTGNAVVGFVIVNPTGTGNFVGGTTDLDDGTVVPNAVYVNTVGPFNLNAQSL